MSGFKMGVIANHVTGSRYQVFCNNCQVSLGTMDFRVLVEAVFNTLGRGGVCCPDCRKKTCDVCAVYCRDGEELSKHRGPTGEVRVCIPCAAQMDGITSRLLDVNFDVVKSASAAD